MKKLEDKKEKTTFNQAIKELEEIIIWFDSQDKADLEEGLKKVKRGNELIEFSKEKLKEVENEFKEVEE